MLEEGYFGRVFAGELFLDASGPKMLHAMKAAVQHLPAAASCFPR